MVTFIATAFKEVFEPHVFIGSMLCQKNPNWKAIIYVNGWENLNNTKKVLDTINDERFELMCARKDTGYWGAYNRIDALNKVTTEYVVQTSIQDYYMPITVDRISMNAPNDFIYWDSIHNHYDWDILNVSPVKCRIDWGSFAVKTRIAKIVGINHPEDGTGDGMYVEEMIAHEQGIKTSIKINRALHIHN